MIDAGAPPAAAGIRDDQSLNRTIAPGCATLLEAADDSGGSATDFSLAGPTPRANAVAPTETECTPGDGGSADTNPPETTITKAPKRESQKAKARVGFTSSEAGSGFMCKLDKRKFKPCDSPFKKEVDVAKHEFRVFAIDQAGNEDPTPAKAKFKRVER